SGARLGVTASPAGGDLQLMFDDSTNGSLQWRTLNLHVQAGKYDGRTLVALPTLTVRLDPNTSTWDLFSSGRLIADHLPLIEAKKGDRRFVLRGGNQGAWLSGLVLADENPLYEDENANGIDDHFEKLVRGALLPASATPAERRLLAQQWRTEQRKKAPRPFFVQRPLPDR
ncbi:MAG: hypothetical protein ACREF9_12960, partial [Opitutaceae bacterium]